MRRHFILEGDKTTAGGVVMEGHGSHTFHGRKTAYQGARIACPGCRSTGTLECVGPRRPYTLPNGREIGLEHDLCLCGCRKPPMLVASQSFAYMDFESDRPDAVGRAADGSVSGESGVGSSLAESVEPGPHSERLVVFNPVSGECAAESYILVRKGLVIEKARTSGGGFSQRYLQEKGGRIEALIGPSGAWSVEYHDGQSLSSAAAQDGGPDAEGVDE